MRQKTKRDWSAYNKSLVKRGDLFLWFDEETLSNWYSAPDCNKQGRPYTYSDVAIQTLLSIREVFHLTYRSLEGFGQSLFAMLGITELTAPDYASICKRAKTLNVPIKVYDHRQTLHLLIDSTGLKVFGEGEWKVKKHGVSKRRTWRKIHIAVDGNTYQIYAVETTKTNVDDAEGALKLIRKIGKRIGSMRGDGAYDKKKVYKELSGCKSKACIPPRSNARLDRCGAFGLAGRYRNEAIIAMRKGDLDGWKERTKYHRRSLAETAMFQIKQIFGDKLKARNFDSQVVETRIKVTILNRFIAINNNFY